MGKITVVADNPGELKDLVVQLFPVVGADSDVSRAAVGIIESAQRWKQMPCEESTLGLQHAVETYNSVMRKAAIRAGAVATDEPPTGQLFDENGEPLKEEKPEAGEEEEAAEEKKDGEGEEEPEPEKKKGKDSKKK